MVALLNTDDLTNMRADADAIIGDRQEAVILRRGTTTLDPQMARIARIGGQATNQDSDGGEETRGRVIVVGSTAFDVQAGDRFNDTKGILYRVSFVRPNRSTSVMAEAEAVE